MSDAVAERIVARRAARKFTGVADLAVIDGTDAATLRKLDAKGLLQF